MLCQLRARLSCQHHHAQEFPSAEPLMGGAVQGERVPGFDTCTEYSSILWGMRPGRINSLFSGISRPSSKRGPGIERGDGMA